MLYADYKTIEVTRQGGAAWVSNNNAPLNVLDVQLMAEVNDFAGKAAQDE